VPRCYKDIYLKKITLSKKEGEQKKMEWEAKKKVEKVNNVQADHSLDLSNPISGNDSTNALEIPLLPCKRSITPEF
jgi:hypothetical protein